MKFYPDLPEKIDHLLHYSLRRPMSFCVDYMYLIGGRRFGKTYSIKTFLFNDFIKNGNKFGWCRTSEIALDKIRKETQFFGRMENLEEIGVKSYRILKDTIYINGKEAGYFFPVKTFFNTKGADYKIVNLVWDEFMRAKGEPNLADKRRKFNDLVESVCRGGKKRIFYISNSTNQFDEVLLPYNVHLRDFGIYLYREKNALIHYIRSSKTHIENMENSASGSLMSESEKEFAFNNKFSDFGDYGSIPKGVYLFSIQVDDDRFLSIFTNEGILYIKSILPEKNIIKTNDASYVNKRVLRLSNVEKRILRNAYNDGRTVFDDGYSRGMYQEIIK